MFLAPAENGVQFRAGSQSAKRQQKNTGENPKTRRHSRISGTLQNQQNRADLKKPHENTDTETGKKAGIEIYIDTETDREGDEAVPASLKSSSLERCCSLAMADSSICIRRTHGAGALPPTRNLLELPSVGHSAPQNPAGPPESGRSLLPVPMGSKAACCLLQSVSVSSRH